MNFDESDASIKGLQLLKSPYNFSKAFSVCGPAVESLEANLEAERALQFKNLTSEL